MNQLKDKALLLRNRGLSYNEISKEIGVAKSTLSSWLCDIKLSSEATARLSNRVSEAVMRGLVARNKNQTFLAQDRARKIRQKAQKKIQSLSLNDLTMLGAALYWAEGYKKLKVINGIERTHHSISFTNSDPKMMKAFKVFLVKVMGVSEQEITMSLRIYRQGSSLESIKYWSEAVGLDQSCFEKPSFIISKSSKGLRPFNRLPYGTAQLRVANTNQFHHLMGLIEGLDRSLARFYKKH